MSVPRMSFTRIDPNLLAPRIPELGQIKIGGKGEERTGKNGKKFRLPVKLTQFLIVKRERDRNDNLIVDTEIHKAVGQKPTELDIRLMFDEPEANFQYFLGAYDGKRKRCSGNGLVAEDREQGRIPCTCPLLKQHVGPYAGPQRPASVTCKPHGRLSVILEAAQAFGGFYVFRTTSWETISSIAGQLDLFKEQFGFLRGLPLRLVMYPTTDQYEEGGELKRSTSYKVALVLRGSFDTARQIAKAAQEMNVQLSLPKPTIESLQQEVEASDARDEADIAAEFHPESIEEFVEAETVEDDEDPEAVALELLIRTALELSDWDTIKINDTIAKASSDLPRYVAFLEEKAPKAIARAREFLAKQEENLPLQDDTPVEGELVAENGEEVTGNGEREAAPAAEEELPFPEERAEVAKATGKRRGAAKAKAEGELF